MSAIDERTVADASDEKCQDGRLKLYIIYIWGADERAQLYPRIVRLARSMGFHYSRMLCQ
jgi:hypothetical protein